MAIMSAVTLVDTTILVVVLAIIMGILGNGFNDYDATNFSTLFPLLFI